MASAVIVIAVLAWFYHHLFGAGASYTQQERARRLAAEAQAEARNVEWMKAQELGLSWSDYCDLKAAGKLPAQPDNDQIV